MLVLAIPGGSHRVLSWQRSCSHHQCGHCTERVVARSLQACGTRPKAIIRSQQQWRRSGSWRRNCFQATGRKKGFRHSKRAGVGPAQRQGGQLAVSGSRPSCRKRATTTSVAVTLPRPKAKGLLSWGSRCERGDRAEPWCSRYGLSVLEILDEPCVDRSDCERESA
jgi:hypothetical protein